MFKQIPLTMIRELSPKQKVQKLIAEIGGGWYMEKGVKVLSPVRRSKVRNPFHFLQFFYINKVYRNYDWVGQ